MSDDRQETVRRLADLNRQFAGLVPHNAALGIEIGELSEGRATMTLPYRRDLVGNPETGVLHGGVITSLMDACCGAAVFMGLPKPMPIATLDLRIDYLKPATPQLDVHARGHCYKVTRNVAFVRGIAFHESPEDAIATATGTFMLSTMTRRKKS